MKKVTLYIKYRQGSKDIYHIADACEYDNDSIENVNSACSYCGTPAYKSYDDKILQRVPSGRLCKTCKKAYDTRFLDNL